MKKRTVIIISSVVLFLLVVLFGAQAWIGGRIKNALETQVLKNTAGACQLTVASVRVNLLARSVTIRELGVYTDSVCLADIDPSLRSLEMYVPRLRVTGIGFRLRKSPKRLSAGLLEILRPDIRAVFTAGKSEKAQPEKQAKESLEEQVSAQFEKLGVKRLRMIDGHVEYGTWKDNDVETWELEKINLAADGFLMGSGRQTSGKIFFTDDIRLSIRHAAYTYAEKSMVLEIDSVDFQARDGELILGSLRMTPQHGKTEFAVVAPAHADWTKISTGVISCHGIDLRNVLSRSALAIDSISVARVHVHSYKNRKIAQPFRYKKILFETVRQIPFGIDLSRINIDDVQVIYEELGMYSFEPGKLTIGDISGRMYGLTNRPVTPGQTYSLEARGKLMNSGQIQAEFTFPADSTVDVFHVKGTLGEMEMDTLNSMIEPLADARINTGRIDGVEFTMAADLVSSSTNLVLLYHGLDVSLLKEGLNGVKERKFLSEIVNDFILDDRNPAGGRTRTTQTTAERDVNRSQFNYLWRSLLGGIKKTVGIPGK